MQKIKRTITAMSIASLVAGCVIDPSAFPTTPVAGDPAQSSQGDAPGPRQFVKAITYPNGQISYFRTRNSSQVKPNHFRICLENNTGQPKSMIWSKVPSGVNNLTAPTNGARSCASFQLNQRLEWVFFDRMMPKKADAMNLGGVGGILVEFIWVRDY